MKEIEMDRIKKLARFTHKLKTMYLVDILPSKLIEILKKHNIDIVVDIRATVRTPMIYMPKYFEDILSIVDISYLRLQKLGNPSKLRKKASENFVLAKKLYLDYIQNDKKAQSQLFTLFKQLKLRKNYCLVCTCKTKDPNLCHRFWLKEHLINIKRVKLGFEGNFVLELKPTPIIQEAN